MTIFANLGPYAVFIVAAYSVTLIVIAGLVAWIVLDHAAQRGILAAFERRGIKRRSQAGKRASKAS
jgi:heme exporter protein D